MSMDTAVDVIMFINSLAELPFSDENVTSMERCIVKTDTAVSVQFIALIAVIAGYAAYLSFTKSLITIIVIFRKT